MISSCRRGTSSADTTYRDPLAREDDTGLRSSIAGARRAWYGARHEPDQPQHTHGIPHPRAAPGRIPARCRLRYRLLHSRAGRAHGGAGRVLGVDIDREWVQYARRRDEGRASYAVADARALPFQTGSFDLVVSITALCFILEELVALRKILRVTRRRFAIGLLNRRSLLCCGRAGEEVLGAIVVRDGTRCVKRGHSSANCPCSASPCKRPCRFPAEEQPGSFSSACVLPPFRQAASCSLQVMWLMTGRR